MCGMKKLSHDIAFNLPGGSTLNARYSRDPQSKNFLTVDEQELRFVGHPSHLAVMKTLGNNTRMVIVHGVLDTTCPYPDAQELVANLRQAEFAVEPRFIGKEQLDGTIFTSAGHPLGNRTKIATNMVKEYFPQTSDVASRKTDFDWADEKVRYPTTNGHFVISYRQGYPLGHFETKPAPPEYSDQHDLLTYHSDVGKAHPIQTATDWVFRRDHIRTHLERVTGPLPSVVDRVPLNVETLSEEHIGTVTYRKVRYQSDGFDKVTAWLLVPEAAKERKRPAMLCLHQTTSIGKDEPVGRGGSPNMHYAKELAERGYVTLSPDYPSFGEHPYDFAANPQYASGSMKAVWDNIRAVDLLSSLEEVDAEHIGVIGHSLGGHNAIFTAVFEPRLKVIVSSCGFSTMTKDDVPSWTGPRYMPRIASEFGNDAKRLPFDFPGLIASLAPRAVFISAATKDDDFDVTGVQDCVRLAQPIFELHKAPMALHAIYPDSPHDFPPAARQAAYEFIDRQLKPNP
jgi:dienelactone hydrolase